MVPGPSASLGCLLEVKKIGGLRILRMETPEMGPRNLCFNKPSR